MQKEFKYYLMIIAAVLLVVIGTIWGGAMTASQTTWATWISAVGALLAAIGAIFAANFTRKTLIFLTRQHQDQQALQRIQMYQAHKEAFMKLLDELEETYENRYRFTDRDRFYRSIFPENNFNKFSTSVDVETRYHNNDISDKIQTYQILIREIINYTSDDFDKLNTIVFWVMSLKNQLHIVRTEKFKSGDVILDDEMFFSNIFEMKRDIHNFKYILDNLVLFSGNSLNNQDKNFNFPYYDLLDYCLIFSGLRGLKVHFNNELLVKSLYAARSYLLELRNNGDYTIENESLLTKLADLFKENTKLDERLSKIEDINDLINDCKLYLCDHMPDQDSVPYIKYRKLLDNLTEAQEQLLA